MNLEVMDIWPDCRSMEGLNKLKQTRPEVVELIKNVIDIGFTYYKILVYREII